MNGVFRFLYIIVLLAINSACVPSKEKEATASNVGVALYSFNRFELDEALDRAVQSDVKLVEGFFFHAIGGDFDQLTFAELGQHDVERVKQMLADKGLRMVSMYAGGKSLDDWTRLFGLGSQLGLEFLVGEPEPYLWKDLNRIAGEHGMKLAIHQHAEGKSRYWHPDSVLNALEGRPNFVACGDIGHWTRSGLDPAACLAALEGHLVSVHVKDLDAFGDQDAADVKVGDGVIDFEAVFAELRRQHYDGYLFVECEHAWEDNVADVRAGVDLINASYYGERD